MTDDRHPPPVWVLPIDALVRSCGRRGGFFVALPEYRPDLIQEMASALDLGFFDFRAEVLIPLGRNAAHLPLDALTDEIAARSAPPGVVIHNAEALLATKDEAQRRDWFTGFVAHDWPHAMVIPITIYQGDLPAVPERFHRVDPDDIPRDTLLTRLAKR